MPFVFEEEEIKTAPQGRYVFEDENAPIVEAGSGPASAERYVFEDDAPQLVQAPEPSLWEKVKGKAGDLYYGRTDGQITPAESAKAGIEYEAQKQGLTSDEYRKKVVKETGVHTQPSALDIIKEPVTGVAAGGLGSAENYLRTARVLGYDTTDQIDKIKSLSEPLQSEGIIHGGVRSTTESLATGAPGMAAGAVAGGGVPGAVVGLGLSAGTIFSFAEYDRFMEEAEKYGLKREDVRKEAIISAVAEGGIEAFTDLVGAKVMGLIGKGQIAPVAKQGLETAFKKFMTNVAKVGAIEIPGEMLTAASQAKVRQNVNIPSPSPWEAAKQVVGPSAVQTLLTVGLGAKASNVRQRQESQQPVQQATETQESKKTGFTIGDQLKAKQPEVYDELQKVKQPPPATDRRHDYIMRKKIAEMTPDEKDYALHHDLLTGLKNERAWSEVNKEGKYIAVKDAEALKYANDTYGYDSGNRLLKAYADSLKEVGIDAYRKGGDEVWSVWNTPEDANAKLQEAQRIFADKILVFSNEKGYTYVKGGRFDYGIGGNEQGATEQLHKAKGDRLAARGDKPSGLYEVTAEGNKIGEGNRPAGLGVEGQPFTLTPTEQPAIKPKPATQPDLIKVQPQMPSTAIKAEDVGNPMQAEITAREEAKQQLNIPQEKPVKEPAGEPATAATADAGQYAKQKTGSFNSL